METSGPPPGTLLPHPAHPPQAVRSVIARVIGHDTGWLSLRWRVEGTAALVLPAFAGAARADRLWEATCFELFAGAPDGDAYTEFNFSPSERWAAYDFTGYRAGMADRSLARAPVITPRLGGDVLICDVALPLAALPEAPDGLSAGLTAVLVETGARSFWASQHPWPQPDFHHPACRTVTLG